MNTTALPANMDRFTKIKSILVDQLGCDESTVTPEANLIEDLGADSLDTVELAMAFEEDFDIELEEESMEKCKTVADIVTLLENLIPSED